MKISMQLCCDQNWINHDVIYVRVRKKFNEIWRRTTEIGSIEIIVLNKWYSDFQPYLTYSPTPLSVQFYHEMENKKELRTKKYYYGNVQKHKVFFNVKATLGRMADERGSFFGHSARVINSLKIFSSNHARIHNRSYWPQELRWT